LARRDSCIPQAVNRIAASTRFNFLFATTNTLGISSPGTVQRCSIRSDYKAVKQFLLLGADKEFRKFLM
jgi:hypothetical protein